MTDEEMRKMMQFILEQQATAAAKIDALAEARHEADERWARADERWTRTEESIRALLAIAEVHEREINTLAVAHAETRDRIDKQMAETDERLNALINTVERIISKGRNGE